MGAWGEDRVPTCTSTSTRAGFWKDDPGVEKKADNASFVRRSRVGGAPVVYELVPVLVPVRASPVPSVVRGSWLVKFFFLARASSHLCRACLLKKINKTDIPS